MKALLKNLRESSLSIVPVTAVIFILFAFGWIEMSGAVVIRTLISMVFLILGVMLFNIGTGNGIQPIGELMAASLTRRRAIGSLAFVVFLLGLIVTIAEPSVKVFADQVPGIDSMVFVIVAAVGVGVFLTLAALRIIFQWKQSTVFTFFYLILFGLLILLENSAFIPLAFDGSAATTGLLTFPLFLSLASGIANNRGGNDANEDSFGMIGLSAIGPMLSIVLLGLFFGTDLSYESGLYVAEYQNMTNGAIASTMANEFGTNMLNYFITALIIVIPIGLLFIIYDLRYIKLPKKKRLSIIVGLVATILGMMFFLTGASVGYVPLGQLAGEGVTETLPKVAIVFVGFILGAVNASAEPGVHVLSHQVEDVSNGQITFKTMLITLSIGLGISVALSVGRIYLRIPVEYILVIGYAIAITLAQIVPSIYTGIAFDSAGAVTGPMTTSFITPFITGIAVKEFYGTANWQVEVVPFAFGSVALVALIPTISIQLLGLVAMLKERKHQKIVREIVYDDDDDEIIYFGEEN